VTGILALATFVSYDFLYTPLKRVHSLSTVVGAVPGALPILGGWTAATGTLGSGGWSLFIILFLWQLPHFLTLSWVLREDYQRAGIRMLSVEDPDGLRTRHQTLVYTLALVPASLLPSVIGIAGALYFAMALPLGIGFIWLIAGFCRAPESARARRVFRYSILYLPLLLIALAIDKV
jgi:heme o synthase